LVDVLGVVLEEVVVSAFTATFTVPRSNLVFPLPSKITFCTSKEGLSLLPVGSTTVVPSSIASAVTSNGISVSVTSSFNFTLAVISNILLVVTLLVIFVAILFALVLESIDSPLTSNVLL